MSTFTIRVGSGIDLDALAEELGKFNAERETFRRISVMKDGDLGFSLSPEAASVVVAGVSSLPLLLTGLLQFMQRWKSGMVEIVGRSGAKLSFRQSMPKEQVEYLIDVASRLDVGDVKSISVRIGADESTANWPEGHAPAGADSPDEH